MIFKRCVLNEVEGKGERERCTQLNAEFQRIAVKKAFLSEQCKEIEENNRMGKTRDLFKKIGDTKGTFLAKMGTIKDKKCQGPKQKPKRLRRGGTTLRIEELCREDGEGQGVLLACCSSWGGKSQT